MKISRRFLKTILDQTVPLLYSCLFLSRRFMRRFKHYTTVSFITSGLTITPWFFSLLLKASGYCDTENSDFSTNFINSNSSFLRLLTDLSFHIRNLRPDFIGLISLKLILIYVPLKQSQNAFPVFTLNI